MRRTVRATVLLTCALLLSSAGLTACGEDEPSASDDASSETSTDGESPSDEGSADGGGDAAVEETAAQSIADAFSQNSDDVSLTDEQATCLGQGMVDQIGVDALVDAGIITENGEATEEGDPVLPRGDASSAAEVLVGCTGTDFLADAVIEEADDISPETEQCIRDAVDEPLMTRVFTQVFSGADEERVGRVFVDAIKGCPQ